MNAETKALYLYYIAGTMYIQSNILWYSGLKSFS